MLKDIKGIKPLFPLLHLYPWAIPVIITLGVLSSLAEGIGIGLFVPFLQNLDQASLHAPSENWLIRNASQFFSSIPPAQRPLIISGCIFGSILLKTCLSYGNTILFAWLETRIGHRLRCGIFEQLLTVGYQFLERSSSGDLLNTLATSTWRTTAALTALLNLFITVCTLVVYTALLLLLSWKLTLLITLVMLMISSIARLITRRAKILGEEAIRTNATLASRMLEGFAGMAVIRAFGREPYEQDRFERNSDEVSRVFMKLGIINSVVTPLYDILAAALMVGILFFTLRNPGSLPSLLVFIFVLYRLQPKVMGLDAARVNLASLAPAVEEVTALLNRADKPYIVSGATRCEGLRHAICFDRVSFRYNPADKPALQDVSISIPAGKTTALVGPSGAGKSTLINLIFRLYDVEEGQVTGDGVPLQELDLTSWRSRIALVSQNVYIFNTTVRENIAYGRLDATKDEIIAAARQADAHGFISQLPQGYETQVGDNGIRLSGGQRQRITLARAIVRNPELLILDEATNALDSISEHLIQETLDILGKNRTVIIIAHRLSTVERADHIIVMQEGSVCEEGDLHSLLKLDGLFARLHKLQNRGVLA